MAGAASPDDPDGRVRRARSRRHERRQQLVEAAQTVFASRGYHATTIADILTQAKVSRGTFYLYFPSKRAVFEALLDQMLAHIAASVQRVRTGTEAEPALDQMYGNFCRVIEVLETHRDLTIILLHSAVGLDADFDQKLTAFYDRLLALIEVGLVDGAQMGLVRHCDTRTVARCILGSFKEVMVRALASDEPVDRGKLASTLLELTLYGVFVR